MTGKSAFYNVMQDTITVRPMGRADAGLCAEMQLRLIPEAFINRLGVSFLRDVYFMGMVESKSCIVLVAEVSSKLAGFLVIAGDSAAFKKELFEKKWKDAARTLLPVLLRRPAAVLRFGCFCLRGRPNAELDAPAELLSIAVEAPFRRQGVGKALLRSGMGSLDKQFGCDCQVQTWRAKGGARVFYGTFGFSEPRDFDMLGGEYRMLVRRFKGSTSGAAGKGDE